MRSVSSSYGCWIARSLYIRIALAAFFASPSRRPWQVKEILKEYLIGTEVYDRKPPYHPSVDSIVRSEARRLRNKLKQYYESVGKDDSVFIYYRPGGYAPVFRLQRKNRNRIETARALSDFLAEGLVARGLNPPDAASEFDVQIVFEGTVRISHPGSEPCVLTDVRFGSKITKRNRERKVG